MLRAPVCFSAGKGFGEARQAQKSGSKSNKQSKLAGVQSGDSKAVQRAVKLVEEQEARQRRGREPGARPVDPREAAAGKVEYVRVKEWGSGRPEELGDLQVDADATRAFTAGGGTGGAPAMPFHEALARRLEMLQTQGALGVAQLQGSKPLPPFELWAFAQEHYVQYLADMHAVHAALEASLLQAAAVLGAALQHAGSGADAERRKQLLQALHLFGPEQGLDRGAALLHDLQQIGVHLQQRQPARTGSSSSSGGGFKAPAPTQHAAAYAAYIDSLARACRAAEGLQEEEQAALRLLAHAYIVQLMHLTSGGRVAAAAATKLGLADIGALAFHRDYPQLSDGAKPLELFVGNTNTLGTLLSEDQREAVMQELPKAMTKSSMLLVPLARER